MKTTQDPMTEAVSRGAALLDEFEKEWFKKIDVNRLFMSSCTACVLGQLYKDYWNGIDKLEAHLCTTPEFFIDEHKFGFNTDTQRYAKLKILWTKEIQKRLNNEKIS